MSKLKRDNLSQRLNDDTLKFLNSIKNKNLRIVKLSEGENKGYEGKLINVSTRGGLTLISETDEFYFISKSGQDIIFKIQK